MFWWARAAICRLRLERRCEFLAPKLRQKTFFKRIEVDTGKQVWVYQQGQRLK